MKQVRFAILIGMMVSLSFGQSRENATRLSVPSMTQSQATRYLFLNTIILDAYFAPYSFVWGTALAGNSISAGESLGRANTIWALASLGGMGLSWFASNLLTTEVQDILKGVGSAEGVPKLSVYRIFSGAITSASILDFTAESFMESYGIPDWKASAAEVKTAASFPALGRRIGISGRRIGFEFETSMLARHTTRQTVYYDAAGDITVPGLGVKVPLTLNDIEIPKQYLMMHSLFMGGSVFAWLPKVIVRPYVGIGAGLLINSVQSQYPGPANLIQDVGSLALDETTVGFGFRGLLGVRSKFRENSFLFAEFRPGQYFYKYDSGQGNLREHDKFKLQIFEANVGIGFYVN